MAREVVLDGTVGGDVQVFGSHLVVGPNARIAGALRYRVPPGSVTIDSAARITGGVTALPAVDGSGFGGLLRIILFVGFLIAGAAAVALFPRLATAAASSIRERTGATAAFGVVWLVGIPVVILVAAVTLVGLPLAAIMTAAYIILLYLGRAAVAVWLGDFVVRKARPTANVAPLLSFVIGAVLLLLIGLVPLIGPFIGLLIAVFGAGSLLVAMWPRRDPALSGVSHQAGAVRP